MDRGVWWATVHVITKSQTQLKQLSTCAHVGSIPLYNKTIQFSISSLIYLELDLFIQSCSTETKFSGECILSFKMFYISNTGERHCLPNCFRV